MPLNRPILDDRTYEQLRDELVRRIPVYAPEWTDHNPSDPGIALIELFSFLAENLLYRFNQIPDATYMEFLRLLRIPPRPAEPARTLAVMSTKETEIVKAQKGAGCKAGDIDFETLTEVRVLPVSCFAVSKTREELPLPESEEWIYFQQAYKSIGLKSPDDAAAYKSQSTPVESPGVPVDFDKAVDFSLWVAVMAEEADMVEAVRAALAKHKDAPLLLNIGFIPEIRLGSLENIEAPGFEKLFRCPGEGAIGGFAPVQWTISTGKVNNGQPVYRPLTVEHDTTQGLTREGVVRLRLPKDLAEMGRFPVDDPEKAGTGDLPPRLDDEDLEEQVVFWLRAFHLSEKASDSKSSDSEGNGDGPETIGFGKVLFVGANAAQIVQTRRADAEFLGTGNGQPNQAYSLVHKNAVSGSLVLEVEEAEGWRAWVETDGFHASRESDRHYVLDSEARKVRFGTGLQGYVPQIGQRIRVKNYSYGGGSKGNVPAGAIDKIDIASVEVTNPMSAYGGKDAESIESALDRIPGELRRRDRAVTSGDFRELALMTPRADIGRAECLPLFHPARPNTDSAGVVSVFVWPARDPDNPNAPMPDKNQLRSVCQWLDARRLVTTELYVLPPKYRKIAVAVGLEVKPGYGVDAVRHWVELVIRQYLAPLPPYGPEANGWPLGRRVYGPELEAAALQVEGVEYIEDLKVADLSGDGVNVGNDEKKVVLNKDEVVELTTITVESGPITVQPGELPVPEPSKPAIPVPVPKKVC